MDDEQIGPLIDFEISAVGGCDVVPTAVLVDHLSKLLLARNHETIWALTLDFLRRFGFLHAVYGYSPDSRGATLGAPEDYIILSTLPPAVTHELVADGHYLQSFTFHKALNDVGVMQWSATPEQCGLPADTTIQPASAAFFERCGMLAGCTIGFPSDRTRGRAVLALVAGPGHDQPSLDALLERCGEMIFVAAAIANRCIINLPQIGGTRSLTHRQREVLEWVADGKTSADIAVIMGITATTVEKHLRLARETLNVDTTAHALIKASFLNQVFTTSYGPQVPISAMPMARRNRTRP